MLQPWEVKPSRMLMMKLTDGQSEVSGVEYRSIECLNDKLPPGCKVSLLHLVTDERYLKFYWYSLGFFKV